ncbi:hypothetical protein [Desulfobacula toluolica]|uniref:hypothetical protein n=1 Tax=Desulfobacula toluolica TaxID=28223 RepID=UPI0002D537C5|nr:hypothetical protein [Desulfobacula toluolica]
MDFSVISDNLNYMAGGLWLTFEIAVMAVTGGLALGTFLGYYLESQPRVKDTQ